MKDTIGNTKIEDDEDDGGDLVLDYDSCNLE